MQVTEFHTFEGEYADLASDIATATHQNFALRIRDWLNLLDETPESAAIIARLELQTDFDSWFQEGLNSQRGMVGSGRLKWAENREERLGQYLGVFRFLASEEDAFSGFAVAFAWAGSNLNQNVTKIADDYFQPFQRDLLRKFSREWDKALIGTSLPADRVVRLDGTAPDVLELREKLSALERMMRESTSNAFRSEPGFDRSLIELAAGNQIIAAEEVRVSVVETLVIPALKWLGAKAAETAVQVGVTAVLVLIAAIFGLKILGIT